MSGARKRVFGSDVSSARQARQMNEALGGSYAPDLKRSRGTTPSAKTRVFAAVAETDVPVERPEYKRISTKTSVVLACKPDGRDCRCCGCLDNERDYIDLQIYILWGYKALHGKNQGRMCFYCMRVFKARYAGIYKICELVDKIGTDKELSLIHI